MSIQPKDTTLNKYMQPNNSPAAGTNHIISGIEFSQKYKRSAISSTKIRSLSFSSGTGGIITVGGTTNESGYITVRNEAGGTEVVIDKSGITINNAGGAEIAALDNSGLTVLNGNLSLENDNSTVFVDAKGIVSSANFGVQIGTITAGTNTGTAYSPVPGGTISLARTRSKTYLIGMNVTGQNNTLNAAGILYQFQIGGTQFGPDVLSAGANGTSSTILDQTASASFPVTLGVGTNNLILNYATSGAGSAIINGNYVNQLYAISLGL